MKFVGFLLRMFSYFFHLLSSVFLLGIASIALLNHQSLNLRMLPFGEGKLVAGAFVLGLFGLTATLLAFTKLFRYLFPLWAAGTVYSLVRGYFFSSYSFGSHEEVRWAMFYIAASVVALTGALWTLKPKRGRLYS